MLTLTPSPEELADLLLRMTRLEWPTTENERLDYFSLLGLSDTGSAEGRKDEPGVIWRQFDTALTGVGGLGTMCREEFLGLSLFCYEEEGDDGQLARRGFADLRAHLSAALGAPVEEWGTPAAPCCLWQPGPLTLDMYCFQRGRSGVMVGPSHAERSAANDAARL